ncbi:hypothetical protein AAFF_G00100000 [Aldrovandia affinis]|uniref:Uncharacterized protein n=1 Tax=Aldrovandia affinis TaxID=143900 RepID=A0AAD7WBR9_9TELE|nr:hypothetical protein AAFF_G00100000 [Aldrovandia affinis]
MHLREIQAVTSHSREQRNKTEDKGCKTVPPAPLHWTHSVLEPSLADIISSGHGGTKQRRKQLQQHPQNRTAGLDTQGALLKRDSKHWTWKDMLPVKNEETSHENDQAEHQNSRGGSLTYKLRGCETQERRSPILSSSISVPRSKTPSPPMTDTLASPPAPRVDLSKMAPVSR